MVQTRRHRPKDQVAEAGGRQDHHRHWDRSAEDPKDHTYGRNSKPESDPAVYLPKDELIAHFVNGYDDAADALRRMDPARLDEPTPIERFRARFPTIAYLPTQFFLKHTSTHLGQLSAWRRAGGRPPV